MSGIALAGVVLVPALFYRGSISEELLKNLLLASTGLWFGTAPFWMKMREQR